MPKQQPLERIEEAAAEMRMQMISDFGQVQTALEEKELANRVLQEFQNRNTQMLAKVLVNLDEPVLNRLIGILQNVYLFAQSDQIPRDLGESQRLEHLLGEAIDAESKKLIQRITGKMEEENRTPTKRGKDAG